MKHYLAIGLAALTLAACDGNPIAVYGPDDSGTSTGGDGDPIDETAVDTCGSSSFVCSDDLAGVGLNTDGSVLTVRGTPFDETALDGTFLRASEIDNSALGYDYDSREINGFDAYENDDDEAFNPYLAIYGESDDGSITVGTVGVMSGYADYGYSGYFYRANGATNLPTEGLVEYDGDYAGIVAIDGSGTTYTSEGGVIIQVDFVDDKIKGGTYGREINGNNSYGEIIFSDTSITSNTYIGDAGNRIGGEEEWAGEYQGIIAGDGTTTGGVFQVIDDDWEGNSDISARETGVFIATTPSLP